MHFSLIAATAKSLQSCPTLWDPIDGSLPGSPVPGILQARTLEWVAISFSNAWKWKVKVKSLSRVWLLATPWTAAYQAPPSMGFSRQEDWSGVPSPSPSLWLHPFDKYIGSDTRWNWREGKKRNKHLKTTSLWRPHWGAKSLCAFSVSLWVTTNSYFGKKNSRSKLFFSDCSSHQWLDDSL